MVCLVVSLSNGIGMAVGVPLSMIWDSGDVCVASISSEERDSHF